LITENGGAVLSASYTLFDKDCVEESSFESFKSSSIEKSKTALLSKLGGSETSNSPLFYELLITPPSAGVLSGITNSSLKSVLSVSMDIF
jgi:hypothetical protein